MHQSCGSTLLKNKAFTLIELLVVIAIIAILAAILFPVFASAKAAAKKAAAMSNAKQIGIAMKMYNADYDDGNVVAWYEWHVPLGPYVKNWQIFTDPMSSAKAVTMVTYTAADGCMLWDGLTTYGSFGSPIIGTYPTNTPWSDDYAVGCSKLDPALYGQFLKNEELLGNFGFSGTYNGSGGLNESMMDAPSEVIYIAMARASGEGPDPKASRDQSPYLEPGSTNWNEVFNMLSARHSDGQVVIWGDTHARYVKHSWLKSDAGKKALVPGVAARNLANNVNW